MQWDLFGGQALSSAPLQYVYLEDPLNNFILYMNVLVSVLSTWEKLEWYGQKDFQLRKRLHHIDL